MVYMELLFKEVVDFFYGIIAYFNMNWTELNNFILAR